MTHKQFDSVWDALYDTSEEVENMKYRSAIQLRFFRDLHDSERLILLNELANISEGMLGCVNLGVQRMVFEYIVASGGKLDKLAQMMEKVISERSSE